MVKKLFIAIIAVAFLAPTQTHNPTIGEDNAIEVTVTDPQNGCASDNVYSSVLLNNESAGWKFSSFGFSIPANATITDVGISVEESSSNGNNLINFTISLRDDTTPKHSVDDNPHESIPVFPTDRVWSLTGTGAGQLTPAILNGANFNMTLTISADIGTTTYYVDAVSLAIDYTVPPDTTTRRVISGAGSLDKNGLKR